MSINPELKKFMLKPIGNFTTELLINVIINYFNVLFSLLLWEYIKMLVYPWVSLLYGRKVESYRNPKGAKVVRTQRFQYVTVKLDFRVPSGALKFRGLLNL
jgi:hypothetical protein